MKNAILFAMLGLFLITAGCSQNEKGSERFKIIISQHAARQTYLLDTETGDTWVVTGDKIGNPSAWTKMKRY
jgi:hypothetical protein